MALNDPLVSVRIPVFNHEPYIEKCLDSVLNDSYPNKELIIMDDGSTDNSPYIIQDWIKDHQDDIEVSFFPRSHRGLARTLNDMISKCRGEYLVSLASDDMLTNDGIRKRIDYLLATKTKLAVFGDCVVVNEKDEKLYESGIFELHTGRKENYFSDGLLKREIIQNWSIPGPVLMVNRDIYKTIGFYDELLMVEDWDLYLKMVAGNLIGFLDEKVGVYRLHENNTCRGNNREFKIHFQLFRTALKNAHLFHGPYKKIILSRMVHYLILTAVIYIRQIARS